MKRSDRRRGRTRVCLPPTIRCGEAPSEAVRTLLLILVARSVGSTSRSKGRCLWSIFIPSEQGPMGLRVRCPHGWRCLSSEDVVCDCGRALFFGLTGRRVGLSRRALAPRVAKKGNVGTRSKDPARAHVSIEKRSRKTSTEDGSKHESSTQASGFQRIISSWMTRPIVFCFLCAGPVFPFFRLFEGGFEWACIRFLVRSIRPPSV